MKLFLLRLFGIFIVLIYGYFRLIYKRESKTLYFIILNENQILINYPLIIFIIILTFTSLWGMYVNIKIIQNKKPKQVSKYFTVVFTKIFSYIKNSLLEVNQLFADYIPNSYNKLKRAVLYFYKIFGHYEHLLFIFLVMLPYLILSTSLIFDSFIYYQINYFYKCLPFVALPLVFHVWLFLINQIVLNLDILQEEIFFVEHSFLNDGQDHFKFILRPQYASQQGSPHVQADIKEYLSIYPLKGFLESYFSLENLYKPYLMFVVFKSYLLCCFYIIITNIIFLYNLF